MFTIKATCQGIRNQSLAKELSGFKSFRVWFENGRRYFTCELQSMGELDQLTKKLIDLKTRFTYIDIEKSDGGANEESD